MKSPYETIRKTQKLRKKFYKISLSKNKNSETLDKLTNISFLQTTTSIFSKSNRSTRYLNFKGTQNQSKFLNTTNFPKILPSVDNSFKTIDTTLKTLKNFYRDDETMRNEYESENLSHYIPTPKVTLEESEKIKKLLRKTSKDRQLIISTGKEKYSNPSKSLQILKENKAISRQMNFLVTKAQAELFENQYNKVVSKSFKYLKPKIKITTLPPKDIEISTIVKEPQKYNLSSKFNDELVRNKLINSITNYQCYNLPQNSRSPNTRTQATFVKIEHLPKTLLLFGGLSTSFLFDFWLYNIKSQTWTKMYPKGESFLPRYGHSCVYYNGNVYIYGGSLQKNKQYPVEDIIIYNIDKNTIKSSNFKKSKYHTPWRRNHICEVASSYMIIHGGIGIEDTEESKTVTLNDFLFLDLNTMAWIKPILEYKGFYNIKKGLLKKKSSIKNNPFYIHDKQAEVKLAYHSSCLVLSKEKKLNENLNIWHFEHKDKKDLLVIKYEGIYIFGGINEYGEACNQLFILVFGNNPLTVVKANVDGKAPPERYSCSMNYYSDLNIIVVYGGRNIGAFNDIFILDVIHLNWIEADLFGGENRPRAEHVGVIDGNKLFIFGGCSENGFLSAKIFGINLDLFSNQRYKKMLNYAEENLSADLHDKTAAQVIQMIKSGIPVPDDIYMFLGSDI